MAVARREKVAEGAKEETPLIAASASTAVENFMLTVVCEKVSQMRNARFLEMWDLVGSRSFAFSVIKGDRGGISRFSSLSAAGKTSFQYIIHAL